MNLGSACNDAHSDDVYDDAPGYLHQALTLADRLLGPRDQRVAILNYSLANHYAARRQFPTALPHAERAVEIFDATGLRNHPHAAAARHVLACIQSSSSRWGLSRVHRLSALGALGPGFKIVQPELPVYTSGSAARGSPRVTRNSSVRRCIRTLAKLSQTVIIS